MIYNAIHGPDEFIRKLGLPDSAPKCRMIYEHGSTIEQRAAGVIFPQWPCWYYDGQRYHVRRGGLFYTEPLDDWLDQFDLSMYRAYAYLEWDIDDICLLNVESPGVRAESRQATMRAILAERCLHYGINPYDASKDRIPELMAEGFRLYNEAAPRWYERIAAKCREWFSGVGYYDVLPNPGTAVDRVIAASDFVAVSIYDHTYDEAYNKIKKAMLGNHGKKVYAVVSPAHIPKGGNLPDQVFEAMVSGADGAIIWDSVFTAAHLKRYTNSIRGQVSKALEAA